jgi:2-hydroxy-6-oxonona-2,4-dienedioate hydrolase
VILPHGLVISSLYMVPTAARLARRHRVAALDLPGFGSSEKPDRILTIPELADAMLAWIDTEGLGRVVLVANSLGCQISVDLASRHPARVAAMVLAGPTIDAEARSRARQIGRWLVDWTMEPPSLGLAHVRDYYQAGLRRAWRTFGYALSDEIERKIVSVRCPVLVVRGERDRIVPRQWALRLAELCGAEYREIAGGPHVVNYTTPDPFVALIDEFLSRHGLAPAEAGSS